MADDQETKGWGPEAFDLHIHSTCSSDGCATPREIVKAAIGIGLGGIAVTDHNSIRGGQEAARCAPAGFIVIQGIEITSSLGHILALGVDEDIASGLTPLETVERIENAGGLSVAVHPHRFWSGLGEETVRGTPFKAIETMNGRSAAGHNVKAKRLAQDLEMGMTGGSDAHGLEHVGTAVTLFPHTPASVDEALQLIEKRLTSTRGSSRNFVETILYVRKSVFEWVGRGMKRI